MPEAVLDTDAPASLDRFTDEELADMLDEQFDDDDTDLDGEDPADRADLLYSEDDGWYDPFAEPLPGPQDTALGGRDGKRAGELLSVSVDAGRDVMHRLVKAAVERLLDDPDWQDAHVLLDDAELDELSDSLAAARAAGDLLGRARVRRLAEAAPAAPVPEKFAEGFQAFDCPRCGSVAYDGDPASGTKYRYSILCTVCEERPAKTSHLRPATARFAEAPPADPFDVFAAEPLPVLKPGPAAEYFRKLVPTVGVKPERYAPLFDRHAYTMAVAADEAVLSKVKSILADVIDAGGHPRDAKDKIDDLLDNVGVTPRNPQYSDLVYRTNAMDSYVQGQQSEYADPEVREAFPAWEYHAVVDERSRPHHAAKDGVLFSPDVTFQEVRGTDPADVCNCVLPGTLVEGQVLAVLQANYAGEVVELRTRGGERLTVTINHPVLTSKGFVRAGSVQNGDHLIRRRSDVEGSAISHDVQHGPAVVEQLFGAAKATGTLVVKRAAVVDLHGDGVGVDGEIEVVTVGGLLTNSYNAAAQQLGNQIHLTDANRDAGSLPVAGTTGAGESAVGHPPAGGVGGSDLLPPDTWVGNAGPLDALRVGLASQLNARVRKPAGDDRAADAEFLADLIDGSAGRVSADEVLNVEVMLYRGHVYDLQTVGGWYAANSILLSNCRCSFSPVHRAELERRLKAGDTIQEG